MSVVSVNFSEWTVHIFINEITFYLTNLLADLYVKTTHVYVLSLYLKPTKVFFV